MSNPKPPKRRYIQKIRADRQTQTRRRITEAALSLHEEIGPARTTISAVARRAGVERPTVYRHFPDEASLLGACRDHWLTEHPPPDPRPWIELVDPEERLRLALSELYGFHRATARMTTNLLRDASISPAVADAISIMQAAYAGIVELLLVGWAVDGDREPLVRAALAHGISFETWHSLCSTNGLAAEEAMGLVISMVRAAADG